MRSEYLSILPADLPASAPQSSGEDSTANEVANSGGDSLSYSARYQAFLDQQAQKNQRVAYGLSGLASAIRGLVNLAIFTLFFLTILTLFGFGLSRLSPRSNAAQKDVSATSNQAETPQPPAKSKKKINK